MRWTTPDFEEISLSSEVTAYVNTDGEVSPLDPREKAEVAEATA